MTLERRTAERKPAAARSIGCSVGSRISGSSSNSTCCRESRGMCPVMMPLQLVELRQQLRLLYAEVDAAERRLLLANGRQLQQQQLTGATGLDVACLELFLLCLSASICIPSYIHYIHIYVYMYIGWGFVFWGCRWVRCLRFMA